MIMATVGFMFGTGGTAIVATTLGEGDSEKANRYFSLFVYVTFSLGVIFSILGITFIRPIAALLGAEGEILENCIIYGRIVLMALPFVVLQYLFQSFFVAAAKPRLGLAVIIAAGVTNMVLDAVLVTTFSSGTQACRRCDRNGSVSVHRRHSSSYILFQKKFKHTETWENKH